MRSDRGCTFCAGPVEVPARNSDFGCCRNCAKTKLIGYLAKVLGVEELARAVAELAADDAGRDRADDGGGRKLDRLVAAAPARLVGRLTEGELSLVTRAELARQQARYERRPMTKEETQLSLASTAIVQKQKTLQ